MGLNSIHENSFNINDTRQKQIQDLFEIKLDVKVDLVENLGFERIVYTTASNKEINIKTSDNISGKTLKISFSKDKIYLFDKNRNRLRQSIKINPKIT